MSFAARVCSQPCLGWGLTVVYWFGDDFNNGNHFRTCRSREFHTLFRACFIREDLYLLTALLIPHDEAWRGRIG
jgi:hypothetical protein